MNSISRNIIIIALTFLIFINSTQDSHATILFSSHAGSGICDTIVPRSEWDTQYGTDPQEQSRMWYRCDTPVPNSGQSNYFRINTVDNPQGTWNYTKGLPQVNMTPVTKTYYLGAFFRFDRISNQDIWRDFDGMPNSSDKLFEFYTGNARAIIYVGFPDWARCKNNECDHHFTFEAAIPPDFCTSGCPYDHTAPNVAPYGLPPGASRWDPIYNYIYADYEKWYAVVLGFTPSSGGSATDGRLQFWINGIKTTDVQNIKTQDSSTPTVNRFYHSGTIAQPAYDAPAHLRKFDQFTFADSLADMTTLGLMSDPELGITPPPAPAPDTTAPSVPGSLSASVISPTQINLSWSASTDNVGVTGYRLERCTGAGCTNFTQIAAPTNTGFQNTTVIAGTTYQYRMRATDAAGNLSGYSSIVSATTPNNTPTPTPTPSGTTSDSVEAFCPGGTSPDPRIIFCENWDVGTPPAGFPQVHNTTWRGWTVDDAGAPTQGLAELATGIRRSGTRSLHKVKRANEHSVPNQIYNAGNISEFRMRFYVYFDATYANVNKAVDEDYIHFIFLQSALSGRGVRMDILPAVNRTGTLIPELRFAWPPTCIKDPDRGAYLGIASPSGIGSTFKGVTQGSSDLCFDIHQNLQRWIPIEWAYRIVNTDEGRASLWIDGVQRMRDELMPPDPSYMTIQRIILSGYMSTLRNYDAGFYLDDIIVANDYTMDLGGTGVLNTPPPDTTPPAVPVNVRVE